MMFLKKFNFNALIHMTELPKFRDDWLIPKDTVKEFDELEDHFDKDNCDEFLFERFLVNKI